MSNSKDKVMWLMLFRLIKSQQRGLIRPLRIKTALLHVKAVQAARYSVMALLGFCFLYLFLFAGFVLFHVGLFLYLPGSPADKGCIFMWLGGGYVLAMLVVCAFALSQKRWMKMSGADKAVIRALQE